jgi:hypothetical protein
MTRDRLDDAFLRLRAAADADEYVPTEQVIDTVLARLARAEKENRWEAYAAFGSNYKDVTAEVIALREERDEALRLLATRVEAKRLDDACAEVAALRAEARRADEEATTLANSDLATTEQVVRALRAENERLREACALALGIMEQKNKMETVYGMVKFVDVKFDPEDIAVLRAALEKKP